MEDESFEDPATAAYLNEHFISVKVDREERPDVDMIYMRAVQELSGSGGWPLTAFLTPDLLPFFGGTYFPKEPRFGRPAFRQVLEEVVGIWRSRRAEALRAGKDLQAHLGARPAESVPSLGEEVFDRLFAQLHSGYDAVNGGFFGPVKFPRTFVLSALLRHHRRTGDERALSMVRKTLERMAAGGVHDQLGGGFHRYSTDERWLVPHFEKMLYDQAEIAKGLVELWQVTGEGREVLERLLDFVLREMRDQGGGFVAAFDADSEGEEGAFYVFSEGEVKKALSGEEAAAILLHFGITEKGNFEKGRNVLHVAKPPPEVATSLGIPLEKAEQSIESGRRKLLDLRNGRPRPGVDRKVLTSWNAMMVGALARAGSALDLPRYVDAAKEAAGFVRRTLTAKDGRLLRRAVDGEAGLEGTLEDYAWMISALVDLYEATFDPAYVAWASGLAEIMEKDFADPAGGFFDSASGRSDLFVRPKDSYDGAYPSGNSAAAAALIRLASLRADSDLRRLAGGTIAALSREATENPAGAAGLLLAVHLSLSGPKEVAVIGRSGDPALRDMTRLMRRSFLPDVIFAVASPEEAHSQGETLGLLHGKESVGGKTSAYVCTAGVCLPPLFDARSLGDVLRGSRIR
jgi:hypothetical protein